MMMKHLRSRHSQAADEFDMRYACYKIDQAEVRRHKKRDAKFQSETEEEGSRKGVKPSKAYGLRSAQQLQFDMELT